MTLLRYTLVSDGSSDRALIPVLTWLLRQNGVKGPINPLWADLQRVPRLNGQSLTQRIIKGVELYPCHVLFVHRDAEAQPVQSRVHEIRTAAGEAEASAPIPPIICVVPVRMQETWLLFDEMAIRQAAGNPKGTMPLDIPPLSKLEGIPDPKERLHSVLLQASGLHGRRRKKINSHAMVHRVADLAVDFSPLRNLSAFLSLEAEIGRAISENNWH